MTDDDNAFLAEGMGRYQQAAATMVAFGKAVEGRLQQIQRNREVFKQCIVDRDE